MRWADLSKGDCRSPSPGTSGTLYRRHSAAATPEPPPPPPCGPSSRSAVLSKTQSGSSSLCGPNLKLWDSS